MKKDYILQHFEFVSGEYEQFFEKAFYAKDDENLENKIPVCRKARHEYLNNYYGEVAVKNQGWREITSFDQLVSKLL